MSDTAAPAPEVKDVKKVKLSSSDNEDFIIERDVALKSVLIKNMLEGEARLVRDMRGPVAPTDPAISRQTSMATRRMPSHCRMSMPLF